MQTTFSLAFTFLWSIVFYAQNIPLYVGTFTNEDAQGIYQYQFNTATGEISNEILAIEIENPNFLTYSPDRKFMYSVNRSKDKSKPDYVAAYKINSDGTFTLINTQDSHGAAPCHIAMNAAGTKIVVSNYNGGTVSLYNVNDDGSLSQASQVFDHNTENEKSHAHSAQFFNDELFVADLGRNAVYQYQLKNKEYKLAKPKIVEMLGNPGPRHFSISKNGKFIYIINEYGSSITTAKRTKDGFKEVDFDTTLSDDYKGKNSCADIHPSPDERFLYGSNRGENSIAVFRRNNRNGKIKKIQNISVEGDWPRNFTLDPNGNFLLVANRRSNNISVFKIDKNTGLLTFLHDTKSPTPVHLLF
ncbi:lactonase family protein [Tamlana crocina]|uniref:Lactonase family protein n=1 Tax=Tamlana crocina TaxID=393006 RepID=A0ABX1DC43_9FLAO|nr:lactonase family protein [Tamlana crocina]NJX14872.1 lactonase family protein [Tamlana crocina]